MKEFPYLELRRADLRHQLNSFQREMGLSIGESRDSDYAMILRAELQELDYALRVLQGGGWSSWQGWLLLVVSLLSIGSAGLGIWLLMA